MKLIKTKDGSHSLFVHSLNEIYHSENGAITETLHVFIKTGFQAITKNDFSILEVGFGTGLNSFVTAIEAEKNAKKIHYTTLETTILTSELIEQLNYPEIYPKYQKYFHKIHQVEWNKTEKISAYFSLLKINIDVANFQAEHKFDLIYFDAFSPEIQPELWTGSIFEKMYSLLNNRGLLVTYCAKGQVRRNMQQAGFSVERLPGPPGKREMLKATKYRTS